MSIHRHERAHGARRIWPMLANAIVASVVAAFSTYGVAQITSGGGAGAQEQRQSDSSARSEPSGTPMHESHKPQSKDASKGRAATAGKDQKPDGTTGFGNGLYGTGAGSNK
ncbi:beta-xylosidase [Burkholderia sp. KK1]|nr:beta-xylosidase [Burkholderia sp. KK1]